MARVLKGSRDWACNSELENSPRTRGSLPYFSRPHRDQGEWKCEIGLWFFDKIHIWVALVSKQSNMWELGFGKSIFTLVAVTSLGLVSPGRQLMVSPYFFSSKKTVLFSHRPPKSDDLFSCRLLTSHHSVVYLVFFLNSAPKIILLPLLDGVARGSPPPPAPYSDAID